MGIISDIDTAVNSIDPEINTLSHTKKREEPSALHAEGLEGE
jgi:hypothetical protein